MLDVVELPAVSFLAPWLAPVSWTLAPGVHRVEMRTRLPGSALVAILAPAPHEEDRR